MHKDPIEYLRHILDECKYVKSVTTPELEKSEFLKNETLKRAVIRSLEIIGEATKRFPLILNINGNRFHGKIWLE